jgi:wyosine [tRNA(Phe)-imidazoG37] synthetase (radical SAM superfamily)
MEKLKFKYLYGPVSSWRLGRSLGVDLISQGKKVCTYDCRYCQLGDITAGTKERKIFVATEDVIAEIKQLPPVKLDYFTFSGQGEPTLAKNLGETIQAIRTLRKEKIAVLTNASLINLQEVRDELALADYVSLKLDACSQELLDEINRPYKGIVFDEIIKGMAEFRKMFKGALAVQIMFIEQNKDKAADFYDLLEVIQPDEVHLNTPLRPSGVKPLSESEMQKIKSFFEHLPYKMSSVYEAKKIEVEPISEEDTFKRRGNKY